MHAAVSNQRSNNYILLTVNCKCHFYRAINCYGHQLKETMLNSGDNLLRKCVAIFFFCRLSFHKKMTFLI